MIQESTGRAIQSINTGNFVASLPPGKVTVGLRGERTSVPQKSSIPQWQPRREATPFLFVVIADFLPLSEDSAHKYFKVVPVDVAHESVEKRPKSRPAVRPIPSRKATRKRNNTLFLRRCYWSFATGFRV
ncbi:hypothetical protein ACSQ67_026268 [Phaseolus vulgaris]